MLDRLFGLFGKAVMLATTLLLIGVLYFALRGGIYLVSFHRTLTIWLAALAVGLYVSTRGRLGKYVSKWLGDTGLEMFASPLDLIVGFSIFSMAVGLVAEVLYAVVRHPMIVTALSAVSAVVILLIIDQKQRLVKRHVAAVRQSVN